MRWIINYIRQCFCKHDLVYEEGWLTQYSDFGERRGERVYCHCKKCGWHKSWWKY